MSGETDTLDEVPPDLVRRIEDGLADGRNEDVRALLAPLSAAGQAHVLTPSVTARGILNMTALSVVEAQRLAEARG